jgi:hypothetical protein
MRKDQGAITNSSIGKRQNLLDDRLADKTKYNAELATKPKKSTAHLRFDNIVIHQNIDLVNCVASTITTQLLKCTKP